MLAHRCLPAFLILVAACGSVRRDDNTNPGTGSGSQPVSCSSSAQCVNEATAPVCDPGSSTCVQCLHEEQCPTGEACRSDFQCHGTKSCAKDDDCGSTASECGSEATCVVKEGRCTTDRDCIDPLHKRCDASGLICVGCLTAGDCGGGEVATCDTSHACRMLPGRCRSEADCARSSNVPHCNVEYFSCVQCTQDTHCTSGLCQSGVCAAAGTCQSDANCAAVSGRPRCNTSLHQCVQCVSNSDCPGAQCQSGVCVASGCTSDSGCTGTPGRPRCNTSSRQCVQCLSSNDCDGGTCQSFTCVAGGCTGDSSCSGSTPRCDTSSRRCVECLGDTDCRYATGRTHCSTNRQCVQCTLSSHCGTGQNCSSGTCQTTSTGTTCSQIVQCMQACPSTDTSCDDNCYGAGSPTAQSLLDSALQCIVNACPSTGGGVCDQSSSTYNTTTCRDCYSTAQNSGGACYSMVLACLQN